MAGPYDYTINIPQPPAQNFLQSLLGIQQLKQMQEQGALQQRQMAFQEQMQPLQIQAEQARIGQIGASTAAAQEALRQGRITFEQAQTERALKTQYQNDVLQLSKSPETWTPEKLRSLSMQAAVLDPQTFGAMNKMFAELPRVGSTLSNAASEVMLSVQAGKPGIASSSLDKYISAANSALEKNPNDKAAEASLAFLTSAKTTVEQDPVAGALTASNFLFNTDPQKWESVTRAMKGAGELAETQAKTKKELASAKVEEAKLTPGQAQISDKQQADINTLTDEATAARLTVGGLTNAVDSLLNFAEQKPKEFKTGVGAGIENFKSFITGETTEAQNLRATIQPFATKEWIAKASGLKGSLSEKEGARLDKGAPDVMKAGAAELLNWMRLVQKVELLDADKKELSAAWQANARSLQAKSPSSFEVANVTVKPGDSYQQTLTKIIAGYKKKSQEDIQADAARLQKIRQAEEGSRPTVPNIYNLSNAPTPSKPAAPKPKLISIE
jgi:hypothetical protein